MKKLVGKICYLSPLEQDHSKIVNKWINDLETAMLVGDEGHSTITIENIKEDMQQAQKRRMHVYCIYDLKTDKLIGRTVFMQVDHINRNAMFGILIGEKDYWGKGYGQDAIKLMLDFGFNGLNFHNIYLGTYEFNHRAIQCYKNLGFKLIGHRREARIIGDKKFDIIFMDILYHEFQSPVIQPLIEKIDT